MSSKRFIKALEEINIFHKDNGRLRNHFFFFFVVAICGYAAIMMSMCPYNDDYCRYVANMHVGTTSSARYTTFFLELLMYFSNVMTDAAPFTQILSCAFLSYTAIVCMKIFNIDSNDKFTKLCLIPIVVNPYLLECLMYRFDSPFIMLSILCSVMAAYLAKFNDKKLLIIQSILLLHSLLLYQGGLSAYFIISVYLLLIELSKDNVIISVFLRMRYFLYTLFITAISYFPFTMIIRYFKKDGNVLINPISRDGMKCIFKNIELYISNLKIDWSGNVVGQLFFLLLIVFSMFFIADVFINLKTKTSAFFRSAIILLFLLLFFITPFGICPLLSAMEHLCGNSIYPRILCCFGIFISIVLYKNYSTINKYKIFKNIYAVYLCCFGVWNIIFLNSAGNMIHYYRKAQEQVLYDLSKDISEITHYAPNKFSHICVKGMISSQILRNFSMLYPIINRIVPEKWNTVSYCSLALFNHEIADCAVKYGLIDKEFEESKYVSKTLLKSHLWYDVYSVDEKILLCKLKKRHRFEDLTPPMLKIGGNN
jgi:hypothetical protein